MPDDPRRKAPHNVQVLQRWVTEQAKATGVAQHRLQRWISFMVVAAALDSICDEDNDPVFVLKGGVAMELRFGLEARATKDYDAAYRERAGDVLDRLDEALAQAHGGFTIRRTEPRRIRDTGALRVDLKLAYRERSWGTVQLEVAPTEGEAGMDIDRVPAIPLYPFGLDGPTDVPCVAVPYQIAQKLHACTEIYADGRANDRFRDLIDVLLLRELVGELDLMRVREACVELFTLRAKHAWPPTVTIFPGWPEQYAALAEQIDFEIRDVTEAARAVETLIAEVDAAP